MILFIPEPDPSLNLPRYNIRGGAHQNAGARHPCSATEGTESPNGNEAPPPSDYILLSRKLFVDFLTEKRGYDTLVLFNLSLLRRILNVRVRPPYP